VAVEGLRALIKFSVSDGAAPAKVGQRTYSRSLGRTPISASHLNVTNLIVILDFHQSDSRKAAIQRHLDCAARERSALTDPKT
jgi:hypothetical protein